MVNQNLNAWVVLAVLAMVTCLALGLVVGIDHVGPGQALRAEQEGTRNAVDVRATEVVLGATQTPQSVYVKKAYIEAQMTAYPASLTATKAVEAVNAEYEQATATQNARVREDRVQQEAGEATRASLSLQMTANAGAYSATVTAMSAPPPQPEKNGPNSGLLLVTGCMVLAGAWVILRALGQLSRQRTQEKLAEAHRELMQQKRLRAENAGKTIHQTFPTSLVQKPGDGRERSRAE